MFPYGKKRINRNIWWSKTTLVYFCAVDCEEALGKSPFGKGWQGGFEVGAGLSRMVVFIRFGGQVCKEWIKA